MGKYGFASQLEEGNRGETILDAYFLRWYKIGDVTLAQQFKGIDREFISKRNGALWRVQYKTDYISQRTNNLVFETVSNDVNNTPGWAYTCQADVLIYLRFYTGEILGLRPEQIRQVLPDWRGLYRLVPIQNEGYKTLGVIVPVNEVRRISWWRRWLPYYLRPKG